MGYRRYQVGVEFSVDILESTVRAAKNPPIIKINPVSVSANKLHQPISTGTTEIVRPNHNIFVNFGGLDCHPPLYSPYELENYDDIG